MPTAVLDPFGNTIQACSISTAVKAKFGKDKFASEAAWAKHVKADAYNTLRAKILNGEVPLNTVVGRTADGAKMVYKKIHDVPSVEVTFKGSFAKNYHPLDDLEDQVVFKANDWDFGPNMAKMAEQQKLIVDSTAKLEKFLKSEEVDLGQELVLLTEKDGKVWTVNYDGMEKGVPKYILHMPNGAPVNVGHDILTQSLKKGENNWRKVEYKVGQVPPDLPIPHGLPVASTSKSVGALTNEDAAAMFVKTKDKLANEAGINIKGSNQALDHLVYKTIADQAGYTPGEMIAKIEAYKASGKKLSALKKKVLPKSGNSTKFATEKSVDNAAAAVKKEVPKPEEVPQVWDSEAVAKAYVKAKDHVVASNDHGWTLYTKNDQFDAEIHKWMQADLGPIKKQTADTAIADYIANHQKLSVLKKQMIKKGELTPKADTLKKSGVKKVSVPANDAELFAQEQAAKKAGVDSPEALSNFVKKNDVPNGTPLATLTDSGGAQYKIEYKGLNENGVPLYEFKYPSGTTQKMTHYEFEDVVAGGDYKVTYTTKAPPKETGAGQVGKVAEDPKVVAPKQQLSPEVEHEIFLQWESLGIPISSSSEKLYNSALELAKTHGLGNDVLPILKAVDKGKTAKFGLTPDQNKLMYEKKVVQHLQNPQASTGGWSVPPPVVKEIKEFGELPADSSLFRDIKPHEMNELWADSMVRPTSQQQHAIRTYTGSSYHGINDPLRHEGKTIDQVLHARHIQDSMSPLPDNVLSRRGTSLSGLGMQSFEQLEASIGKTFMEPAFSSTAVGGTGQFGGQVTLHIQSPKGTQASWFKPYSNIPGENELVLAARTHFKITKVEVSTGPYGDKRTIVHVRVVKQEKI